MEGKVGGLSGKNTRELAAEGQRHLDETIEATFQILSSMDAELCNPAFWSTTSVSMSATSWTQSSDGATTADGSSDAPRHLDITVSGALEDARSKYSSSMSALCAVLSAISAAQKTGEVISPNSESRQDDDELQMKKLEEEAFTLRKELSHKNKVLKLMIDQLRHLVMDISLWQSPSSS